VRALALVAAACAAPLAAQAPPGPPTRWTVADGLPQGTVNDIVQTPEGELWIATFGGLLRFDGLRFGVLDLGTAPALPSHRFTALDSDGAGGLWACTQDGALVHVVEGRVVEVLADARPIESLDLLRHPDGALWVAGSGGAVRRVEGTWAVVGDVGRPSFGTLALRPDGTVLAGGQHRLALFAADGTPLGEWPMPEPVTGLAAGPDGRVLVASVDDVFVFEGGAVRALETSPPALGRTTALWWDGAARVVLGQRGALFVGELEGDRLRLAACSPVPAGTREVRVLKRDVEDNLWLGLAGDGLERRRLAPTDGEVLRLGRLGVTGVLEDAAGRLWIASECGGLRSHEGPRLAEQRWKVLPNSAGEEPCVQALALDGLGRLWIGAQARVACSGPAGLDPPAATCTLDSKVVALVRDGPDGMWALSEAGSLWRLDDACEVRERVELGERGVSLALAPDGSLWVGGDGHLWRRSPAGLEAWDERSGLPRGGVRALLADPDGTLWLALYGGGLVRFRDGRARRWSTDDGLPDNSCSGLLDDGEGGLWVLCNRGVARVERAELEREGRLTPVLLGLESGVAEGNAGFPSAAHTASGDLWFGTIEGASRVRVDDFPYRARAPVARIERVLVDEVVLGPATEVPALTRRVDLEYTAFALTVPERVRFRVWLEPFEDTWHDNGFERTVSYTSLAPGEYTFRVSARSEQGVWSDRPAELRLVVRPAWWQRASVQALAALGVLVALVLAYRTRVGVLQRRSQVLLEAIQARNRAELGQSRLRDELAHVSRVSTTEGLAASLAHEVNQPLAAISTNAAAARHLLEREPLDVEELREIVADISSESRRASDVVRSLREFLGKRSSERRPFAPDALVRDTLPLVQREFDDHRVQLDVDLGAGAARVLGDRVQVQQVLVNLLKNACEAFPAHQDARRVRVRSAAQNGNVRIDVTDNGPGLAPEVARDLFRSFVTTKPKGMGLGLSISSIIAEAHGGRLRAGAAPGGGARFELDLPVLGDEA